VNQPSVEKGSQPLCEASVKPAVIPRVNGPPGKPTDL